jgi:pimeloyl-ACP methyl ester carboxylesterase
VSTPPFIDLPDGVTADRWAARGTEFAVLHAGFDEARDWVILVPGFTGSKEDFIAVLPLLADAGMGALAFDQLGQYESSGSALTSDYALAQLAADVAALAAQASVRLGRSDDPHLVGHSFGGLVVEEAVAGGHLRPSSLTLLCTGPGALPAQRWAQLPDLVAALDVHDLATIWRIMREMDETDSLDQLSPQIAAFLERRWHANSPAHLRACAVHLMQAPDPTERLRTRVQSGQRVAVMWGEHDDAWPIEVQQRFAAQLGAAQVCLPGLGHSPNAEDPARTAAALLSVLRAGG